MKVILVTCLFLLTLSITAADKFDDDLHSFRKGTFTLGHSETEQAYLKLLNRFVECYPKETAASFRCRDPGNIWSEQAVWVYIPDTVTLGDISAGRVRCEPVKLIYWVLSGRTGTLCGVVSSYT